MKSRVIKLSNEVKTHYSDNIETFLKSVIEEYSLQRFVLFIVVSDHAPNMIKSVKDCGLISIGCSCHKFELIMKSLLDKCDVFKKIVEKCNRISIMIKRNTSLRNAFKDVQETIYGLSLSVITSVITRWFSNYPVMKRLYDIADDLESVIRAESLNLPESMRDLYIEEHSFSESEKMIMKFFIEIIAKIVERSNSLSSEKYPTLSILLYSYCTLVQELNIMKENIDNETYFNIRSFKVETISNTFNGFHEFENSGLAISSILNYNENENNVFHMKEVKEEFLNSLLESLKDYFECNDFNVKKNEYVILSAILNPCIKFDCFIDDNWFEEAKQMTRTKMSSINIQQTDIVEIGMRNRSSAIDELDLYISEKRINNKSLYDIINYWNMNKERFPKLYELSKNYLYLLCSSTPSERLFSNASQFRGDNRQNMLPNHLEDECIMFSWISREGISLFDNISFK